jgi:hypothetical protein
LRGRNDDWRAPSRRFRTALCPLVPDQYSSVSSNYSVGSLATSAPPCPPPEAETKQEKCEKERLDWAWKAGDWAQMARVDRWAWQRLRRARNRHGIPVRGGGGAGEIARVELPRRASERQGRVRRGRRSKGSSAAEQGARASRKTAAWSGFAGGWGGVGLAVRGRRRLGRGLRVGLAVRGGVVAGWQMDGRDWYRWTVEIRARQN